MFGNRILKDRVRGPARMVGSRRGHGKQTSNATFCICTVPEPGNDLQKKTKKKNGGQKKTWHTHACMRIRSAPTLARAVEGGRGGGVGWYSIPAD